jgi:hypothetical protein
MGKIELEALRKRARAAGIDHGAVARANRAKALDMGSREWCPVRKRYVPSAQMGLREPREPRLRQTLPLDVSLPRRWVVAVCKPSMALGVADDLNELGFVAYCPLSRKVHLRARARVGRRKMIRQYPVFGDYLFVGEVDEPLQGSIHGGISYLIGDSRGALSVPASFVLSINQAELDGKWDETKTPTWSKTFKVGDQVRISAGPFTGFAGLVDACSKAGIRVDLDLFGRRTSTTLKPSALELA